MVDLAAGGATTPSARPGCRRPGGIRGPRLGSNRQFDGAKVQVSRCFPGPWAALPLALIAAIVAWPLEAVSAEPKDKPRLPNPSAVRTLSLLVVDGSHGRVAAGRCADADQVTSGLAGLAGAVAAEAARARAEGRDSPAVVVAGNAVGQTPLVESLLASQPRAAQLASAFKTLNPAIVGLAAADLALPKAAVGRWLQALSYQDTPAGLVNLEPGPTQLAGMGRAKASFAGKQNGVGLAIAFGADPAIASAGSPADPGQQWALTDPAAALNESLGPVAGTVQVAVLAQQAPAEKFEDLAQLADQLSQGIQLLVLVAPGSAGRTGRILQVRREGNPLWVVFVSASPDEFSAIDLGVTVKEGPPELISVVVRSVPVPADQPPHPPTLRAAAALHATWCAEAGAALAPIATGIALGPEELRQFVLAAMRSAARADVAVLPASAVLPADDPLRGNWTLDDLARLLPVRHEIVAAMVTGSQLTAFLAADSGSGEAALLALGATRTDANWRVHGIAIEEDEQYRLVTTRALAETAWPADPAKPASGGPVPQGQLQQVVRRALEQRRGHLVHPANLGFVDPAGFPRWRVQGNLKVGGLAQDYSNTPGYVATELVNQSALQIDMDGDLLAKRVTALHAFIATATWKLGLSHARDRGAALAEPYRTTLLVDEVGFKLDWDQRWVTARSSQLPPLSRWVPVPTIWTALKTQLLPPAAQLYRMSNFDLLAAAKWQISKEIEVKLGYGANALVSMPGSPWRSVVDSIVTVAPVALAQDGKGPTIGGSLAWTLRGPTADKFMVAKTEVKLTWPLLGPIGVTLDLAAARVTADGPAEQVKELALAGRGAWQWQVKYGLSVAGVWSRQRR